MSLQYYDHTLGRERFKRRYIWAVYAFAGGLIVGMIFAQVF